MRKKTSALQTQMGTLQKQAAEEKSVMQKVVESLEAKLQDAAKEKVSLLVCP